MKPRNIGVLKCWIRVRNAKEKAERWKIVPYGGQCGKKEIKDVLRASRAIYRILR